LQKVSLFEYQNCFLGSTANQSRIGKSSAPCFVRAGIAKLGLLSRAQYPSLNRETIDPASR
jgi:hypothetical protein